MTPLAIPTEGAPTPAFGRGADERVGSSHRGVAAAHV